MARIAERPYMPGDPLPDVGSRCMVAGANTDITCDQDREYSERSVIGYTPCGTFVCFQTRDCWPTVERLTNCWFAPFTHHPSAGAPSREAIAREVDPDAWDPRNDCRNSEIRREKSLTRADAIRALYATPPTPAVPASREEIEHLLQEARGGYGMATPGPGDWGYVYGPSLMLAVHDLLSERPAAEGWRPTHRHVKRGTTYRVFGVATVQCGPLWSPTNDHSTMTVYQGEDRKLWVRPTAEFNDGRFEFLPAPPAPAQDAETERCMACGKPFKAGDPYYPDTSGGFIHAACCGTDPEGYTDENGAPLGPTDTIPEPAIWTAQDSTYAVKESERG